MHDLKWYHTLFASFLTLLSNLRIAIAVSMYFHLLYGTLLHSNLKGGWIRSRRYFQKNGGNESIHSSMVCCV